MPRGCFANVDAEAIFDTLTLSCFAVSHLKGQHGFLHALALVGLTWLSATTMQGGQRCDMSTQGAQSHDADVKSLHNFNLVLLVRLAKRFCTRQSQHHQNCDATQQAIANAT